MKRLGLLVVLLSFVVFAVGCPKQTTKPLTKKPGVVKPVQPGPPERKPPEPTPPETKPEVKPEP
ncbi:MAG: hypothetical protein ACUVUC_02080, partial [Thermoguttaceae bacterium]